MATKQNNQPKTTQATPEPQATSESTVKAGRVAEVRNVTQAYYGFERKPEGEQKVGSQILLCPYFSGEGGGYEDLEENEAVKIAEIPEDEWKWILENNPTVKRDCSADLLKGQDALLMVNYR